jgi:hypothetical protein
MDARERREQQAGRGDGVVDARVRQRDAEDRAERRDHHHHRHQPGPISPTTRTIASAATTGEPRSASNGSTNR